ncbi:MAG: YfhO family protein, partial [Acetatifactor sp.]|nr:YfhO family protein [Acetatifactor sp.]
APSDGYVVLLQSNYPGWNAYMDGQVTEIQTVDGCFIGIPVKQGYHQIIFEFCPLDFFIGLGCTSAFVLVLLFLAAKYIMARKKEACI